VQNPQSSFVASFVGTPPNNLIPVAGRIPGQHHAMYRPENITVSKVAKRGALPMEVLEVSPLAGRVMVTAGDGTKRITAVVNDANGIHVSDMVYMQLPTQPECVFGPDGRRIS
jgi:iron(III) transport system ATP-binding protein